MLRRIGGLSGLFVLLTLGWYLVFPFVTGCGTNTTAPETEECEELITPVMSFLCALPPLMIAVFVFIITHGRKPKTMLQLPTVESDGTMHLPAGVQQVEETLKQTQLAQSGLGIGGVMMAASSVLIVLAALLMVLLGSFCAMGGASTCSDDEFEWLISWMKFGNLGIKLGLVVFFISAVAKLVMEYQLEAQGVSAQTKPLQHTQTMERSACPACGAKLRFPPEHQGEVQCPKCQHVFVVGMD
jgi:hypothetical protein